MFSEFPFNDEKIGEGSFSELESSSDRPAILIAVKDKEFATVLSYNLNLRQFNCLVAEDGKRAVSIFFRNRPEIAVLSFGISKKDDGMEAAKEILRLNSRTEVIVLTDSDSKVGDKAERCGVELFVENVTDASKVEDLICAMSSLKKPTCTLVKQ